MQRKTIVALTSKLTPLHYCNGSLLRGLKELELENSRLRKAVSS